MNEVLIEHQKLAATIGDNNSALAREIAEKHNKNTWVRVLKVFERQHEQTD